MSLITAISTVLDENRSRFTGYDTITAYTTAGIGDDCFIFLAPKRADFVETGENNALAWLHQVEIKVLQRIAPAQLRELLARSESRMQTVISVLSANRRLVSAAYPGGFCSHSAVTRMELVRETIEGTEFISARIVFVGKYIQE